MINSGTLVENIYDNIVSSPVSSTFDTVIAYENNIKPTPVNRPICAVSVYNSKIGDKIKETLSTGEIVVTNKREMVVTISVDIYSPYALGGNSGHKIYDKIADLLVFKSNCDISATNSKATFYDRECQALVLHTTFDIKQIVDGK